MIKPPVGRGRALKLSHWDLWFCVVAQQHFAGSLAGVRQELLRLREESHFDSDRYTAKLHHLRDLRRRLDAAGLDEAAVVNQAGPLSAGEVRRARGKVLEKSDRRYEWSQAMLHPPRERRQAEAWRGLWPQFPVSPEPFETEILARFDRGRFYPESRSFSLAARLDRYTAKAAVLLDKGKAAEALAMLRAVLMATLEMLQSADDSCGMIGSSFQGAFRRYLKLPRAKAGIDDAVFFADLLTFMIWEDYGLTDGEAFGYFRRLTAEQASLCMDFLRQQLDELREDDLDYQAEQALTLLGQIAAEKCRFEMFEALADEMGTREWDRILRLADAAVRRGRRDVALSVLAAALRHDGPHHRHVEKHYRQLKRGRWAPRLLGGR